MSPDPDEALAQPSFLSLLLIIYLGDDIFMEISRRKVCSCLNIVGRKQYITVLNVYMPNVYIQFTKGNLVFNLQLSIRSSCVTVG
jgi:hypothetical protein